MFVANGHVVGLDPADPISVDYAKKVGSEPTGKENPELLTNQKPSHGHDMTIVNASVASDGCREAEPQGGRTKTSPTSLTKRAVEFVSAERDTPYFLYFATHDAHVPRCPHPRFRGKSGHGLRGDAIVQLDCCVGEIIAAIERQGKRTTRSWFSPAITAA